MGMRMEIKVARRRAESWRVTVEVIVGIVS